MVFLKEVFENVDFEKKSADYLKACFFSRWQELNLLVKLASETSDILLRPSLHLRPYVVHVSSKSSVQAARFGGSSDHSLFAFAISATILCAGLLLFIFTNKSIDNRMR